MKSQKQQNKKYNSPWSEDEHILCLDLYYNTKPTERDKDNEKIKDIANLTDRTPASIVYRLGNYSAIDPNSKLTGFTGGGKKTAEFFQKYRNSKDVLRKRAEAIKMEMSQKREPLKSKQLQKLIKAFNENNAYLSEQIQKCQKVHKDFLQRWPLEQLPNLLSLDKYVEGRNDHDTFCYWIERKTRILGSILGARADKFKVYFSPKNNSYKWVKEFDSPEKAFEVTKHEIIKILTAAESNDFETIKKNKLFKDSHLFRGKILYLYFPEKFLNVFAPDDIDYFLDRFGINYESKEHVMDKQKQLIQFKNSIDLMSDWDNLKFGYFLYDTFRPPSKSDESKQTSSVRIEEGTLILPDVKHVQLKEIGIIDLGLEVTATVVSSGKRRGRKSRKKPNYIVECLRNTKLGDHAEEIVLEYEQSRLAKGKIPGLAKKVHRVSAKDDSLGYDILSFTMEGDEKYIEVKATRAGVDANTPFYLTDNEKTVMDNNPDKYQIYRVFAANTMQPRLLILDCDQFGSNCKMKTQLWQVSFK